MRIYENFRKTQINIDNLRFLYYNSYITNKKVTNMANKHNNLREQRHNAATEQFASYKKYIVEEFIRKFGGSYQMPEQYMKTWRKEFDWTQEREDFIKEKTNLFICLLSPEKRIIYRNPIFFKTLMYCICNYLAVYTCRKEETLRTLAPDEFIDKTPYQEQLLHELYEDNKYIKVWLEKCTPADEQKHSE